MADAPKSHPDTPPGERLANYFDNFFKTIVGVSTLGASLTFNQIVKGSVEPFHHYGFSGHQAIYLLAISWLFFVISLAFTSFFASALSLWRPAAVKAFGTENTAQRVKVLWFATGVSTLLLGLVIVAFITLSLVVVAFAGPVGWIALTFVVIFATLSFGTIIWRSPLDWPAWIKRAGNEELEHIGILRSPTKRSQRNGGAVRVESGGEKGRYASQGEYEKQPRSQTVESTYGRSTSGDYRGGGSWRPSQRPESYDANQYSRGSTITSDAYEPGRFGQGGYIFDDGVREGLVMSRYAQ